MKKVLPVIVVLISLSLLGIIAFEITVTDLQSKEKLNQNKSERDRLNVKKHLEESADEMKQALGKMMPKQRWYPQV